MNSNSESKAEDLLWIAHHSVVVFSIICAFFIVWLSFEYPSEFRIAANIFAAVLLVYGFVIGVRIWKKKRTSKE